MELIILALATMAVVDTASALYAWARPEGMPSLGRMSISLAAGFGGAALLEQGGVELLLFGLAASALASLARALGLALLALQDWPGTTMGRRR